VSDFFDCNRLAFRGFTTVVARAGAQTVPAFQDPRLDGVVYVAAAFRRADLEE
jgi:hypothetical protein